jgi:hypothetical protein
MHVWATCDIFMLITLSKCVMMCVVTWRGSIQFRDKQGKGRLLFAKRVVVFSICTTMSFFIPVVPKCRTIRALSAASAAKFNIAPVRWQHPSHVAIVPPESKEKREGND